MSQLLQLIAAYETDESIGPILADYWEEHGLPESDAVRHQVDHSAPFDNWMSLFPFLDTEHQLNVCLRFGMRYLERAVSWNGFADAAHVWNVLLAASPRLKGDWPHPDWRLVERDLTAWGGSEASVAAKAFAALASRLAFSSSYRFESDQERFDVIFKEPDVMPPDARPLFIECLRGLAVEWEASEDNHPSPRLDVPPESVAIAVSSEPRRLERASRWNARLGYTTVLLMGLLPISGLIISGQLKTDIGIRLTMLLTTVLPFVLLFGSRLLRQRDYR